MEISLQKTFRHFLNQHPRFQEKNLLKIRLEVSREILRLDLGEERRAYLIHQLSYAHSVEEVSELATRILDESSDAFVAPYR